MKKAFSLIELSIVILIIGILVAGVTQSSRLVGQFRISAAQSLTRAAPVSGISNLLLWYETSLDESFISSEVSDASSSGSAISSWNDINPQSSTKNNATQSTSTAQPKYYPNVLNGLPAITFDGTSDFMPFDGAALAGSDYTVFIVTQRKSTSSSAAPRTLISGTTEALNSALIISYVNTDNTLLFSHYTNDLNITVPTYAGPIPTMHTFRFSKTAGKQYWSNGGVTADFSASGQTTALISFTGAQIGRWFNYNNFYNGDIFEIIIFSKALSSADRQSVESYLSKKYSITIT